jgi:hypothetical protein
MGTVSLGRLAVIDSAFDLTRPGKTNEGDGLGSVCIAARGERRTTFLTQRLSPPRRVEAVANDGSEVTFPRRKAVLVGTVETLHGWWTLETQELMVSNLSLKLYHGGKLRWGYQHLMTEAPASAESSPKIVGERRGFVPAPRKTGSFESPLNGRNFIQLAIISSPVIFPRTQRSSAVCCPDASCVTTEFPGTLYSIFRRSVLLQRNGRAGMF